MSLSKEIVATCSRCGEKLPSGLADGFCPRCALQSPVKDSESAELPEPEVREKAPERIGKYRILKEIGEGGFGIVYMAEQKEPVRRRVALKVLKRGMDTRQVVTRFELERQALAMMDHPNVAMVFDGGETDDGRPFFAMEYVEGVPITKFCDNHKMPIGERLELMMQVCRGLQHCHQKGLIHRDVKPPNVLVTMRDGRPVPKIIDFGIAKVTTFLTKNTLFTDPGKRVGTPVYMSPEQFGLDAQDVDVRTDIYSIGALLYELLTGATPFDHRKLMAAGYAEMERTIREQEPPKPSVRLASDKELLEKSASNRGTTPARLRAALRSELDWIVLRAMAKSRERRYQSASDLADDLTRYLKGEPVKAGPPTLKYRASRFVRRHRGRLAAAAAVLLLAVGMVAYNLVSQRQTEANRTVRMLTGPDAKTGLLPFSLAEIQPHLDSVADDLETIALDSRSDSRAKLHAAIAVLPRKPEVLPVLMDALLALDPTDPKKAEDLEDCLKVFGKYHEDSKLDLSVWSSLKERAWKEVPPSGEKPSGKSASLAAIAFLARFDVEKARARPGLLRDAIGWTGVSNPIVLSQFRELVFDLLNPVTFEDPILRDGVSKAIGRRGDLIYDFDLLTLRKLKVESKLASGHGGIRSLKGLEMAINLDQLDLDANAVTDISALREMTGMKELDLQSNGIRDISPLEGMKDLEQLDLRHNKLLDLSPLSKLTNLQELQLSGNDALKTAETLIPLEKLANLQILEIRECKLTDISFVAKLPLLERLDLKNNEIEDLSPIEGLKNLQYLDVNYNRIKDPRPLLKVPKVQDLDLLIDANPIPEDVRARFYQEKAEGIP